MTDRPRTFANDAIPVREVSKRTDRAEREADQAAHDVAKGRSVARNSLKREGVGDRDPVQRQEGGDQKKSDDDKKVEALKKTGEAILETDAGKALKKKVMEDPAVKSVTDALTSPVGLAVGGAAVAAGVAGLAAAGKELPFQAPEIPLDKITPGLSGKVTATGPLNAPTFVGIAITYKEQGPKDRGPKQTKAEKLRAENAKRATDQAAFRASLQYAPGSKEAEEQRMHQDAINWVVSQGTRDLGIPGLSSGPSLMIPLRRSQTTKKKEPVQRSPASASDVHAPEAAIDGAVSGAGRPLDEQTRRTMESRFGHNFASVRIHDDAPAAAVASSIDASAFTVGDNIVVGAGRLDTSSGEGVSLLAHELAHVIQQDGEGSGHRKNRNEGEVGRP